jgi:hypothetical protein
MRRKIVTIDAAETEIDNSREPHMSVPARRAWWFLQAIATTMIGTSSIAEAGHHRFYWTDFYRANFYRARSDDRDQGLPRSTIGNSPSRGEANASARAKAGDRDQGLSSSTSSSYQFSGEGSGFGTAVGRMIAGCEEQATVLKKASFGGITRAIQGSDDQLDALEHIQSTATSAADTFAVTCPQNIPEPLGEKLATLSRLLDGIVTSLKTLRPAIVTFYSLLDDEQKARLVINSFRNPQPKSERKTGRAGNEYAFEDGGDPGQDPVCGQWLPVLRNWPIKEIETAMALSDEQHAAVYEVGAAMYRAASGLVMPCRVENRLTPVGRLDAQREKLQTLRHGIDAIRPVIAGFENLLDAEQKKSFDTMVNASSEFRTLAP